MKKESKKKENGTMGLDAKGLMRLQALKEKIIKKDGDFRKDASEEEKAEYLELISKEDPGEESATAGDDAAEIASMIEDVDEQGNIINTTVGKHINAQGEDVSTKWADPVQREKPLPEPDHRVETKLRQIAPKQFESVNVKVPLAEK